MQITRFKSGGYVRQRGYASFLPETVNHEWIVDDPKVNRLLHDAARKLGELNALASMIPDADFFLRMYVAKEATASSRIEGTQTRVAEALQRVEFIGAEKYDDWHEVHNYIDAMNVAIAQLKKLPVSNRLLKLTHKKLMQGVRGRHKSPGEFRTSQNWIGGVTLTDAAYIPPHHHDVPALMSDLEKFLNNDALQTPALLRIGIAHYQFESIHPFPDGNGRIGRLMIALYFIANNILTKPALYLSDFFNRHRSLYYDNLTIARTQNNLAQWLTFFLVGVLETAEHSIQTFHGIISLRKDVEEKKIITLGKRVPLALQLMRYLYANPTVHAQEIADVLNVNVSTANRLIQEFGQLHILKEQTGFRRNRIFVFEKYLSLFEKNGAPSF